MFLEQMTTDQTPADYERVIRSLTRKLRQERKKRKAIGKRKRRREYFLHTVIGRYAFEVRELKRELSQFANKGEKDG